MPRDIEAELRRSLQTRAGDVAPDPAMYARVQSRIRRVQTFRYAFAGAAAALAVAVAAVAAPRLMDRRIKFEPGPVATQPGADTEGASELTSEPPPRTGGTPPVVFTDGSAVYTLSGTTTTSFPTPRLGGGARLVCTAPCELPPTIGSVAVLGSTTDYLQLALTTDEDCPDLYFASVYEREGVPPVGGLPDDQVGFVEPSAGCSTTPVFAPDGESLAWAVSGPDGWSIQTVNWTSDGPGEEDANFGLPPSWPADQHVDIQEWVWTEQNETTVRGYLVLRTQRDGAWVLLRMPVERQADGALAITGLPEPVTPEANGVPVAYASPGAATSFTMEFDFAREGLRNGQMVWRNADEVQGPSFALPPELYGGADIDIADLWLSASPDGVLFGNTATGQAWWRPDRPDDRLDLPAPEPVLLDATMVHADLLLPGTRSSGTAPVEQSEPSLTEIDVYFGMTGADACVADQQVQREVEGAGVARAALTELLEGPTSTESNAGIASPFNADTAGALNGIAIVDGQARVDLDDFSTDVGNDSCTKSAIVDSLNKTLLQFPTITSTKFSFDGDVQAWDTWLGLGPESPPAAVVDTSKAIYDAALASNWSALRRLSDATSCTMSDQPEPCVPYWKEQEANGEDPLGILVDLLSGGAAKNPNAPIWVYPPEWADPDSGYSGPRVGIDEDGVWRYYVLSGG